MRQLMLTLFAIALLAAGCGGSATTTADSTEPQTSAATGAPETDAAMTEADDGGEAGATVAVTETDLGPVLVDGEGMVLYLFTNDEQGGPSTCYDDCATNWPPLEGPAQAAEGADDSLLGTTERDDGTQQVTYNDWPLYYFAGDQQAGDVNGQGVGGVWFAVTPDGEQAEEAGDDSARGY